MPWGRSEIAGNSTWIVELRWPLLKEQRSEGGETVACTLGVLCRFQLDFEALLCLQE